MLCIILRGRSHTWGHSSPHHLGPSAHCCMPSRRGCLGDTRSLGWQCAEQDWFAATYIAPFRSLWKVRRWGKVKRVEEHGVVKQCPWIHSVISRKRLSCGDSFLLRSVCWLYIFISTDIKISITPSFERRSSSWENICPFSKGFIYVSIGVIQYGGTGQSWRGLASALEDGVEAYIKSGI